MKDRNRSLCSYFSDATFHSPWQTVQRAEKRFRNLHGYSKNTVGDPKILNKHSRFSILYSVKPFSFKFFIGCTSFLDKAFRKPADELYVTKIVTKGLFLNHMYVRHGYPYEQSKSDIGTALFNREELGTSCSTQEDFILNFFSRISQNILKCFLIPSDSHFKEHYWKA